MAPKSKKKKKEKGAGKAKKAGKTKKDVEDMDYLVQDLPTHEWVVMEFEMVGWAFSKFTQLMKSDNQIFQLQELISENHGRVENISLYPDNPKVNEGVKKLDNDYDTIQTIFGIWGDKDSDKAPKIKLYYNFDPYNSTEPVLLALGTN